mgnify:CR=1 FL=1
MSLAQFASDGAEYAASGAKTIRGGTINDLIQYLIGNRPDASQRQIVKDIFAMGGKGKMAAKVGRFAGRLAPGISAIANVADVADIVAGGDNLGNKAMDTAAMGLGGAAGFFLGGGPLGASMGASLGKVVSDGTQAILGGTFGQSPEERKLEEALALLKGGRG